MLLLSQAKDQDKKIQQSYLCFANYFIISRKSN